LKSFFPFFGKKTKKLDSSYTWVGSGFRKCLIRIQKRPDPDSVKTVKTVKNSYGSTTLISCLAYVNESLRGTRDPVLSEGRSIATILRREYPKMYALPADKSPGKKITWMNVLV
jgi:hypothetical protein